jgi:hypothetical protein
VWVKKLDRRSDLAIRRQAASSPDLAHAPGAEVSAPLRSASPAGSVRPRGAGSGDARAPPSAEDPQARRARPGSPPRIGRSSPRRPTPLARPAEELPGRPRHARPVAPRARGRSATPVPPAWSPARRSLDQGADPSSGKGESQMGPPQDQGRAPEARVDISATTIATVLRRGGLGQRPAGSARPGRNSSGCRRPPSSPPASGPTRRTTWRTGHVVGSEHRPRSVTSRPRPSMAKSSMTTRRVRTGSPPSPWCSAAGIGDSGSTGPQNSPSRRAGNSCLNLGTPRERLQPHVDPERAHVLVVGAGTDDQIQSLPPKDRPPVRSPARPWAYD